jgi:hypothetical protein
VLLLLSACGAKSPLEIDRYRAPDAGSPDLGVDLGPDLGPDLGTVDAGPPCIPLPVTVDAGVRTVEVALDARTSGADVAFLVDVTGSMNGVITQLQDEIRGSLVPALRAAIPDVRFSVSSFADFPVDPYGSASTNDTPYSTRTPMTTNIDILESAVGTLAAEGGGDEPESQVEALYQLATGAGRSSPDTQYVPPATWCPPDTFGHPCFRHGALPLVFVFTDITSHNGPGGTDPYALMRLGTTPATYLEAIDALNARGMPVVTFWARSDLGVPDAQRQLARDTGAIDALGEPLVFSIGSSGTDLVARVLEAVGTIGDGLATNIDLYVTDPVPGDAIDAVALVSEIIPLRAEPASGIDGIDVADARFLGVRGATRVIYSLEVRTDLVVQRATPQEILLDVHFRGDGGVELGVQRLRFVVPAFDGTGCEPRGV